jgi:hypothetical protein
MPTDSLSLEIVGFKLFAHGQLAVIGAVVIVALFLSFRAWSRAQRRKERK